MINENESTVVIVGPPSAGKTTLSETLAAQYPDYKIYHTDDYISHGFEASIYKLMDDVRNDGHKLVIIEGTQAARILRKGVENNNLFADLVIKIETPEAVRLTRYAQRQGSKPYPYGMEKSINKVYTDYLRTVRRMPRIITHVAQ